MSYLQFPRLAFSGLFQADVSTVNNDPRHFDNANFEASFQEYTQTTDKGQSTALNGWWHPTGTGIFRFAECKVRSLMDPSGALITDPSLDAALGCSVGNAIGRPSGKMVDLDPDWQLASNIYGLAVSLLGADGKPIMTADYQSNPFRDLWFTRANGKGDTGASAMFQSLLTNVQWHLQDVNSTFFEQLLHASERDLLSIRLSTYGYNMTATDALFGYGTVLGAIGPAYLDQPRSFVLGRRFIPTTQNGAMDLVSGNGIGCFSSFIDPVTNSLQVDLSNALPLGNGYQIQNLGPLQYALLIDPLTAQDAEIGPADYRLLGEVDQSQSLQDIQAGIQSLLLPPSVADIIGDRPLAIIQLIDTAGKALVCVREALLGLEVRPDTFTFRLDPNDPAQNRAETELYAARYGSAYVGQELAFWIGAPALDYSNTPASTAPGTTPKALLPVNNVPGSALSITPARPVTNERGKARITLSGPEFMGTPREYMDGQFYAVSYNFAGSDPAVQQTYDKIAVVIYSTFPQPGQHINLQYPIWENVQPILQQYANLYPVMSQGLFDFSKQRTADANAFILHFVFNKPLDDPDQMPVTRDLSASKRTMLINYFQNIMQKTGKTMDRQVMFGKRCPLRASAQPDSEDIAAMLDTPVASKLRDGKRK